MDHYLSDKPESSNKFGTEVPEDESKVVLVDSLLTIGDIVDKGKEILGRNLKFLGAEFK